MPWFLYLALKQLFPTGRWFPFFTAMSVLGVAVGVALLVITTSIMGGFGHEIRRMIVDTQGEIRVVNPNALIDDAPQLMAQIEKFPAVAATTPFAEGVVVLMYENRPAYPAIQGIDLTTVEKVIPFARYLVLGSMEDLDDDSVILSLPLARSLGVPLGAEIEIYSPLMMEKLKQDEIMLPRVVRVAGFFRVGHHQLDRSVVIAPMRLMQELYGLGPTVHGINVRLKPDANEFELAAQLNATLPEGRRALTWFETNVDFQNVIRFEKYMVFFLLAFIVVVAALSIMSSLSIAVVRKTREIGLLGALGGSARQVACCFCAQGLLLGIIGTILGLGLAWLVITFRDDIVHVLARLTVSEEVFQQFYGFVHLPSHTTAFDLTIIIIGSIVSATVAGLLPALRAARLKPVEALRSE